MSNLAGAKSFIDIEDVDYKSAVSEALIQKIAASVNWLQENNNNIYTLGDYIYSFLDTAAFQALYGVNFVKAIGQSIAGTDLDTTYGISTLPDMRAQFVRGLDNSRGIDSGRVMATTQTAQNASHTHLWTREGTLNPNTSPINTTTRPAVATRSSDTVNFLQLLPSTFTIDIARSSTQGVTSGRSKNVSMFLYVKVDN